MQKVVDSNISSAHQSIAKKILREPALVEIRRSLILIGVVRRRRLEMAESCEMGVHLNAKSFQLGQFMCSESS